MLNWTILKVTEKHASYPFNGAHTKKLGVIAAGHYYEAMQFAHEKWPDEINPFQENGGFKIVACENTFGRES